MITIKIAPIISKLFLLFVLTYSIVPLANTKFEVIGMYLSLADIALFTVFLLLVPLYFKKTESTSAADVTIKLLYFIIAYALLSTIWTSYDGSYRYIFYQVSLTFLTISIPHLVSKITNDKHINYHKLISNISLLLTFVFLFYILISQATYFRLNGPLASAAIIGVVIIPPLAVHLHNIMSRTRVLVSAIGFVICLLSVFLTQSRVAIVMLALFLLASLLRKPTIKRVGVTALLMILILIFFSQDLSLDRFQEKGFDDQARSIMHDSSISWWTHSTSTVFFGNGYGDIWQWAAYQQGEVSQYDGSWKHTEHGPVMYHAHSILNQLLAELGLIGMIAFAFIIVILIWEGYKSWRDKTELKTNIIIALICTLPTFFTDLMIFRNWGVSIVWLFYLLTVLRYIPNKENNTRIKPRKATQLEQTAT